MPWGLMLTEMRYWMFCAKNLRTQIERVPYPTGTVQVTLDAVGVPCYDIREGVAWDNIPFTDELRDWRSARVRLLRFVSAAQCGEPCHHQPFSRHDARCGGPSEDIRHQSPQGFYTKEILCESMRRCNILKINDEELVTVSRIFGYPGIDLQDKCWILLAKYNLKMLILTCGTNGSYVFTPGVVSFQKTPKVKVADTVGAGRFLYGYFHHCHP